MKIIVILWSVASLEKKEKKGGKVRTLPETTKNAQIASSVLLNVAESEAREGSAGELDRKDNRAQKDRGDPRETTDATV